VIDFNAIKEIVEAANRGEILDEAEAPNRPHPLKGIIQGEDRILCIVLPNTEYVRRSGIIVGDTTQTQDVPRVGVVVQRVDNAGWLKKLWRWMWCDPYKNVKLFSYVMFKENSGDYFVQFGIPYMNIDPKFVRFVYNPVGELTGFGNEMAREGLNNWKKQYESFTGTSAPIPSLIKVTP